jgi:hypothetical protein
MVRAKYQDVLDLGKKLDINKGKVEEENGKLMFWGTASSLYETNLM